MWSAGTVESFPLLLTYNQKHGTCSNPLLQPQHNLRLLCNRLQAWRPQLLLYRLNTPNCSPKSLIPPLAPPLRTHLTPWLLLYSLTHSTLTPVAPLQPYTLDTNPGCASTALHLRPFTYLPKGTASNDGERLKIFGCHTLPLCACSWPGGFWVQYNCR